MDSFNFAIVEYATRRNFANVFAALEIEKMLVELVHYDSEKRTHLARAGAYIPITTIKVLIHHVLSGSLTPGWSMEVYGGSNRDGELEARVFCVEYNHGPNDKFAQFPFRITITHSKGELIKTGGIKPVGKPTINVGMRFPYNDFLGICLEIRDYLLIHQRELEKIRYEKQKEKFLSRRNTHG